MRNLISNISNLSATGYGVNNILVKQIIDILEHTKSKTIRVLDFGCSKKPYKYLFDKYEHIEQYIGVDVYDGEYVDVVYDGDILPFEDEYFDLVFSSSVLEHVEDLDNSLYELARVTRGGEG
jgi:SAM-dependent methyltransferase